jgi:hypothetical protein
MGYAPQKFGPSRRAERVEVLSSPACLQCGHVVTDHHRAGGGWHNGNEDNQHRERSHCIGNSDTCPCRKFIQPHQFTTKSIYLGGS